jgi:hypothetical protein
MLTPDVVNGLWALLVIVLAWIAIAPILYWVLLQGQLAHTDDPPT